jgi:hypothetical protein
VSHSNRFPPENQAPIDVGLVEIIAKMVRIDKGRPGLLDEAIQECWDELRRPENQTAMNQSRDMGHLIVSGLVRTVSALLDVPVETCETAAIEACFRTRRQIVGEVLSRYLGNDDQFGLLETYERHGLDPMLDYGPEVATPQHAPAPAQIRFVAGPMQEAGS